MAELNPTLQIPTYFTQGKEDNSQYGHSFMTAFEAARRENSPLAKQQLLQAQQQTALFPIRKQAMELELRGKVADLATNQAIMADKTRTRVVAGEVAGIMAKVTDWANADAEVGQMADAVSRNWTPDLQRMLDGVISRAESASRVREANQIRLQTANKDEILHLTQLAELAEARGDSALAASYRGKLTKMTTFASGMSVTLPDGTVIQQGGGGPDALTKPNMTKVQDSQANALSTIDIANRLEPLISSDTVGVKAFAESWVKDRILAQAFPEMASGTRASAEQLASQLRASAVKELRSDSNITEGERSQILNAIPQINNPVDSPARAKDLLSSIRKMSAIRAMVAAKRMGGSIPKAAALVMDDETLLGLVQQGLITAKQAEEGWKLKRAK